VQPRIGSADGLAFVIQGNSPNARGGGGGGLGYTGIARSVAVKFDIWNLATHRSSTGIYFDGEAPDSADGRSRSIFMDTDPNPANRINFNNSHVFRIDFSYDGTTLTETVTDTGGTASFTTSYVVDIAAHVGSNFGYVGFSGGTGGETAVQDILTWTYKFNESHPGGGAGPSSFGGGGTPDPVIATNEAALLPGIANDSDDFSFDARMLMASAARSTAPEETAVLDERNQTANSLNRWSGELVNGQLPSVIESRLPLAVDQVFSGVQRRIGTLYERADTAIDQLFAQDFF